MDIGKEKRTTIIEPVENPVPQKEPVHEPEPEREREKVPAGPPEDE